MKQVKILADMELKRANKIKPLFADEHHGWAVMLEEAQECEEDMQQINSELEKLWNAIRSNKKYDVRTIRIIAMELACEAIQVAAMAQKYIDSMEANNGIT